MATNDDDINVWRMPRVDGTFIIPPNEEVEEEVEPLTAEQIAEIEAAAREEGLSKGYEEGHDKGYNEGYEQGLQQGLVEMREHAQAFDQALISLEKPLQAIFSEI